MKLGRWLRNNGLTQAEAARRLYTSQNYVSELVHGRRWPSRALAQRIFDLTEGQVEPTEFLERNPDLSDRHG